MTAKAVKFERHHWPIEIYFAPTVEAWDALMKEWGKSDAYNHNHLAAVTTFIDEGYEPQRSVITIGPKYDKMPMVNVIGTLAHECMHVVQRVEAAISGKLGREPAAYLIEALMEWTFDEYRKAGRGWAADAPGGPS